MYSYQNSSSDIKLMNCFVAVIYGIAINALF